MPFHVFIAKAADGTPSVLEEALRRFGGGRTEAVGSVGEAGRVFLFPSAGKETLEVGWGKG